MSVAAKMDFGIAAAVHGRLESLLTRKCYREARGARKDLPEFVDEFVALTGGFREVFDALTVADDTKLRPPLAAVLPLSETAGDSVGGRASAVQRVTAEIAVYAIVGTANDPSGRRARCREDLSAALAATRAALIGWAPVVGTCVCPPPPRPSTLQFRRGELAEVAEGRAIWRDVYAATYWVGGGALRETDNGHCA